MLDHTGTWQFISTARLLDPVNTTHLALDDMESVFWVFLYLAHKYGNHTLSSEALANFFMDTFDHKQLENGLYTGGLGKQGIIMNINPDFAIKTVFTPKPLNAILHHMRNTLSARYEKPVMQVFSLAFDKAGRKAEEKNLQKETEDHADKMKLLEDSIYLRKIIKHFTSDAYDWSNDGTAIRHEIPPPPDQASRLSTPKRRSYSHHAEQYKRAIRRRLIV